MVDLHTHDMFSRFDGFGRPSDRAKVAKKLCYTSLSTTNHGNTNGLVQTYKACKKEGLKAILGVEGYFLPVYNPQERGYHLCLFAKNLIGYKNLNIIQTEGEKQKYYNPIWDFSLLEEFSEGLICTSACVASYSSQCIIKGEIGRAKKYLKKMVSIFGDDFYIEVQPYKISEEGLQEKVNVKMIELADELGIKCILTSDSHMGSKDDFDTYLKMHQMDKHDLEWVRGTYEERYMPTETEIKRRFVEMHKDDFGRQEAIKISRKMLSNIEEIEEKVEDNILDGLKLQLPTIGGNDSYKEIVSQIKHGLKKRGQYTKEYINRCKEELDVIRANGFIDYFLIVSDYVNWAKKRGIVVGPGRGSVCNCLVAYAMYITEVDSIKFNLDFRRFMRYDKKTMPDIDIDFEMDRRKEVINYIMDTYEGHSARVSSYGLYQIDNTVNELAKVCGLDYDKDTDAHVIRENKEVIASIKKIVSKYKLEDGSIDNDELFYGPDKRLVETLNHKYDNIITHFTMLFGKVKFISTHAAGVIITSGSVLEYTSMRMDKEGNIYASYNLDDLDSINIIKFDILGLKTLQSIGECRKLAKIEGFDISEVDNPKLLEEFRIGNTSGIFQFEKNTAKRILNEIGCSEYNDVVATCAMNRPGPLSQGMPEMYAHNKMNGFDENSVVYKYTEESYGTIVYQEQLLLICVFIGGLDWNEADTVLKVNKHGNRDKAFIALREFKEKTGVDLEAKFISNAIKNGVSEKEAIGIWESLMVYSFNKGHAVGYCILSMEEMFYKYYYPTFFWYSKIKYAGNDSDKDVFCNESAKSGIVVFTPHVNYSMARTSIRKLEGEYVLQKGLSDIKDVGEKAAEVIYNERKENGIFKSYDDFYDRCKGRSVNTKVIRVLEEQGATDFNKQRYIKKVTTYNSSLFCRASK